MRVTFVLPSAARVPMGGAKVAVAYAERLAARGHAVTVVGPTRPGDGWRARAFGAAVAVRDRLHGVRVPYFEASGVATVEIPSPAARHVPLGDVVVAVGWQTVPWVAALPATHGRPAYFVQGRDDARRAASAASSGLRVFTCARWLAHAAEANGVDVMGWLANAVDPDEFGLDAPLAGRAPRVLWLYHRHPVKGPQVGLDALSRLLAGRPDAEIDVFCARPPSHAMPRSARVHVRPDRHALRRLYNGASVFLHSSDAEGWPLPPMEAMACGAAVAATANAGVREYLDASCGRLVPVGDGTALGEATLGLLDDEAARVALANAARARVGTFSWAASTDRLARMLERIAGADA